MAVEGVDMAEVLLGGRGTGVETLLLSPGERDGRRYNASVTRLLGRCELYARQQCRVRSPGVLSSQARGECCRYRTQSQSVVEGVLACRGRVFRALLAGCRARAGAVDAGDGGSRALVRKCALFSCQSV